MLMIEPGDTYIAPRIKQYEAAGFRAWPAASVKYDGAWAIRLTAGHPAKRLNSINMLDRSDDMHISRRLGLAAQRFRAYGRPLVLRVTPLTPQALTVYCDDEGWSSFGHSMVMRGAISDLKLPDVLDHIPMRDVGRFVEAALATGAVVPQWRAGLSEIIQAIEPEVGLFVQERDHCPVATAICVQEAGLAGLFEVATAASHRRRGLTRHNMAVALQWAKARGATSAWLQVEADNRPAVELYKKIGLVPFYSYHYRQPAQILGENEADA